MRTTLGLCTIVLAASVRVLLGQPLPSVQALRPATAEVPDGFTIVGWVRELRDGRVLIADRYEMRVVVADLSSGDLKEVGRKGRGPGEFTYIYGVFALDGDSTLIEDRQQGRWIIVDGDRPALTLSTIVPGASDRPPYSASTVAAVS